MRVTGPGAIAVHTVDPVESEPGATVRVRVTSAGICGSDLHLMAMGAPRVTVGHEIAGVGEDGMPVAIEPLVSCGECDGCRRGDRQQCRELMKGIYGIARDGGMADDIVVAAQCVVPLPETIDPADASLVEPLAIAVHLSLIHI